MNFKRCDNGHLYNADKYQSCPDCAVIGNKGISAQEIPASSTASLKEAVIKALGQPVANQPAYGEREKQTVTIHQTKQVTELVTGWLACITGQDFGKCFCLKSGSNTIGRGQEMDIILRGDPEISDRKHAVIYYEPQERIFYAQPGESRELFYVNDEVVLDEVRMHQHDILMIGNTRLVFFPFCSEAFSWDDYVQQ